MKRFYKTVATAARGSGHAILLDGRPVKTPARADLVAPNAALADHIAREWAAQKEFINPHDMPMTQILGTLIDRISRERPVMENMLSDYIDTDLLCYRAAHPHELAAAQDTAWDKILKQWEAMTLTKPITTHELTAIAQPENVREVALAFMKNMDDARFNLFQIAVGISGSFFLSGVFVNGALSSREVFNAMRIEENHKAKIYNEDFYGPDPAQHKKDAAVMRDLDALALFRDNLN